MEDLPEQPFKQVLSYLNLKDRLKARTVSKAWRNKFDSYPVNILCYSQRPSGFIWEKSRWVSGAFAENFISSIRFASFFYTFGRTILSSLKHLRLCDLNLDEEDTDVLACTLNIFSQLEELDIIRAKLNPPDKYIYTGRFYLTRPMLTSLHIETVEGIEDLIVEAPRLRDVKVLDCSSLLRVEIVHSESVEKLHIDSWNYTEVKKLKNLRCLYVKDLPDIDPTLLSSLQQLKEIHTNEPDVISNVFEQKQRYNHADLKIYLCGLLLNGPHDPAMNALGEYASTFVTEEWLGYLAENWSRLADQIPFCRCLEYFDIEDGAPGPEVDLLKRFIDLNEITTYRPVEDIERFLGLLKNFKSIVELYFCDNQPQDLFDRLPEHCAVQKLTLHEPLSDLAFLFRLKHLIHLKLDKSIDHETVRRAFEELPALSSFEFKYGQKTVSIEIDQSKQFLVSIDEQKKFYNLNAAIESIIFWKENEQNEKTQSQQFIELAKDPLFSGHFSEWPF